MIEVKVVRSMLDIKQLELEEIAKLHIKEMPETLSSIRGEKTVADLYKKLLRNSGCLVLATRKTKIVGVLSFTEDYKNVASMRAVIARPKSWFRVISSLGVIRSIAAISDSIEVACKVKSLNLKMLYITTLFVERNCRNSGIASLMFNYVKNRNCEGNQSIWVDTKIDNMRAFRFYAGNGMIEYARTSLSVILRYENVN